MALYRFRVTFEDYDDVMREIDVKSNQTFEDLHRAIHQSTGYNPEFPSSFYISNDQWMKGEEITYLPNQKRKDRGISLMTNVKLLSFIDDPHQKFYYTFNFDRPFDFHVELMKIILDETPGTTYPAVIKSVGEAPKQFGNVFTPAATAAAPDEDFDFLNEMAYNPEDAEDFSEVTDIDADLPEEKAAEDEEDDEFGNEFADDEGFDDDDKPHRGGGDDY
ncbi:IS1096 element passenger TnpR family protein [Mucilaginibacter ginsenosidivorax]|uniref:Plasmid pRiA4b ORF-3 family protein n=1 Tax=Mucilaginibacter ginsenosidivorax TaxID=862126 RepID=A0A5B8W226_9SPHI|nr:plasmid pRiA4b ORF-3 family protein [Mucilaginibacter ginsenosidivorax]QEC78100.1 plasmid pRiA4b ORF-3 family protein [Mucilaginibacter ginsenosidivorax]